MLEGMTALVDKNLIRAHTNVEGTARFSMLETIREFAFEQLIAQKEQPQTQQRHLAYIIDLAEQAALELHNAEQKIWTARLEQEHDNIRIALHRCITNAQTNDALRLSVALFPFWSKHGYLHEGLGWLEQVLALPGGEDSYRAKVLNNAGNLALWQGDIERAHAHHKAALAIRRRLGNSISVAASLNNLGLVAMQQGDLAHATGLYTESLAIKRNYGDDIQGIAITLHNLGNVAIEQQDYARAQTLFEESLNLSRHINDILGVAGAFNSLGIIALERGEIVQAQRYVTQGLALMREIGDQHGIIECLESLAQILVIEKRFEHAARLWGANEQLRKASDHPVWATDRARHERALAVTHTALDDATFTAAWQSGAQEDIAEIIKEWIADE
jgi:tetratricopeptide (TPR) repeat protein